MKPSGWLAALFGPLLGLTACAAPAPDTDGPLAWLEQADAQQDALAALEKRDFRLMALPRRGLVIPGIEPALMRQYELKCGVRLIEGAGDAVHDRRQLELLKKASRYAAEYNAIIKTRCKP
jgi:hypothetical protein